MTNGVISLILLLVVICLLIFFYIERRINNSIVIDITKESLIKKYHEQTAITAHTLIDIIIKSKEQIPFAFAVVGYDKIITDCNLKFNTISKQENAIGKSYEDFTHPDDLDKDNKNVESVLNTDLIFYRMKKRYIGDSYYNNEIAYVVLTVYIARAVKNHPSKFFAIIRQMTKEEIKDYKCQIL